MHIRRWVCLLGCLARLGAALAVAAATLVPIAKPDPVLAAVPTWQAPSALPAGITLEMLASFDVPLPWEGRNAFVLQLERVPLDPREAVDGRDPEESGGGLTAYTAPSQRAGAHVLYVEAGEVLIAADGERTLRQGESLADPPPPVDAANSGGQIASYEMRNETGACASVLRLSVWVLPGQMGGVPAAPSGPQRGCGSYELLFHDLVRFPWPNAAPDEAPVQIFLARLNWTAEAWLSFTPLSYAGPVALVVESGEFSLGVGRQDAGIKTAIPRGGTVRIDAGVEFTGEWAQPGTSVLIAGVAPAGDGWSVVPPRPTSDGGVVSSAGFAPGDIVRVNDDRVRLRAVPSTSGAIVAVLARDTVLTVTGAPESRDGFAWYPVADESGRTGYVASDYLAAVAG